MRRKLEQKIPLNKVCSQMHLFLSLDFAVRMQGSLCMCVSRWLSHPTQCDYEKKCFTLSILHIYIPAHTDSLSTSLQKHCSNNPWIAGLCCHPTISPPGLHSAAPQSSSGSVTMTPMMKTQATKESAHSGFIFCLLCEREEMVFGPSAAITLCPPPRRPSSPPSSRL